MRNRVLWTGLSLVLLLGVVTAVVVRDISRVAVPYRVRRLLRGPPLIQQALTGSGM
jgi:hypothetical protein